MELIFTIIIHAVSNFILKLLEKLLVIDPHSRFLQIATSSDTDVKVKSVVGAKNVEFEYGATLVADVGKYTAAGSYEPVYTMTVSQGGEVKKTVGPHG